MTPQTQSTVRPAMTARLLHASLTLGVVLFGLVTHFVVRPARSEVAMEPIAINVLVGASLAITMLGALVMRPRVPRRNTDESADLYWTTATPSALMMWAVIEGGGLLGVVAYLLNGSLAAMIAAATSVAVLIALTPGRVERA
jgi:hypothetical protein